ncbi:MAG: hypothetical protein KDA25_09910, partial [Phycisphaerales bacterium]|nr:hypothetical protein [Phycisphaerales bacterium]
MAIALMAIGIVATRTNAADAIPPLTDQDRARLEAAVDGRDYRDEAFVALRDHAATWTGATPGAEPIRLEPDVEALLADPAAARGALCRVVGVLQQQHPVDASYGPASEWFVRRTDGRVLIVYVAGAPVIADGAPVAVVARWYKPISLVARDGVERTYPAFVGAMPATGGGDGASAPWPLMGGVVI